MGNYNSTLMLTFSPILNQINDFHNMQHQYLTYLMLLPYVYLQICLLGLMGKNNHLKIIIGCLGISFAVFVSMIKNLQYRICLWYFVGYHSSRWNGRLWTKDFS